MNKDSYPEFPAPQGFELPEGAEPDKEFDSVCTLRLKSNGQMCITKIQGLPVSKSSPSTEMTTGQGMAKVMRESMAKPSASETYDE